MRGVTVDAVWGQVDVTWNDTWRLAAGARWEDFSQLSVPIDQYEFDVDIGKIPVPVEELENLALNEDDYYPAAAVTWMIYYFILIPFNLEILEYVSFILVIASLVQLVEMFVRKISKPLYDTLGIYLPLITTNSDIL